MKPKKFYSLTDLLAYLKNLGLKVDVFVGSYAETNLGKIMMFDGSAYLDNSVTSIAEFETLLTKKVRKNGKKKG